MCEEQEIDGCLTGVLPDQAQTIFINGILNPLESHMISLGLVDERLHGVMGIFNRRGHLDVTYTDSTNTLINFLTNTSHSVTLIGHSQGGAIIAEALQALAGTGRLNNITVYTFGSPATNYPQGPDYRHCSFVNDPITQRPFSNSRYVVEPYNLINVDFGDPVANHDFHNYMNYYDDCIR